MNARRFLAALALLASVVAPQVVRAQTAPYRTITSNISGLASAATMSSLAGQASCTATVSNTWVGTLQFRETNDGVHYNLVTGYPDPGTGAGATQSTSANGSWTVSLGSFNTFQVYFSAWTSGAATVVITCGSGVPPTTASVQATITGGTVNANVTGGPVTTTPSGGVESVQGTGTPGAPSSNVLTVQGPALGGTAVPVNCTIGCNATAPWSYFVVPASSTCVAPSVCVFKSIPGGTFAGMINESTSIQSTGNCIVYDNASAASGTIVYIENQIGAGQIITMPSPGIALANGGTVQCAVAPTGNGLLLLFK